VLVPLLSRRAAVADWLAGSSEPATDHLRRGPSGPQESCHSDQAWGFATGLSSNWSYFQAVYITKATPIRPWVSVALAVTKDAAMMYTPESIMAVANRSDATVPETWKKAHLILMPLAAAGQGFVVAEVCVWPAGRRPVALGTLFRLLQTIAGSWGCQPAG
jgi:hypothetical protein